MKETIDNFKKYEEVKLEYGKSHLNENQIKILEFLIDAAKITDEIFWIQNSHDGIKIRREIEEKISIQPCNDAFYESIYIDINFGPYDVLDKNRRFYGNGSDFKYEGAGFYPEGLTKEEFLSFINKNPDKTNDFMRMDTMIRGNKDSLEAIPYRYFFSDYIKRINRKLREASIFCNDLIFKDYLVSLANDLEGDNFNNSDNKWLNINDFPLDMTIGPIEIFEDKLLGIKGSYEGVVYIREENLNEQLYLYKPHLNSLEKMLPIDNRYIFEKDYSKNVMEIVNVAYMGGEANCGTKPISHCLPNNINIISKGIFKNQIYNNIINAKVKNILLPIADIIISDNQKKFVEERVFTRQVIFHEIAHGLGPTTVENLGKLSIQNALKEHYGTIENTKSDILSLQIVEYFIKNNILDENELLKHFVTQLSNIFRGIRFGITNHCAKSSMIQLNYFLEQKAIYFENGKDKLVIDKDIMKISVQYLSKELLNIEIMGDYDRASKLIAKYCILNERCFSIIENFADIPVDIRFVEYLLQ